MTIRSLKVNKLHLKTSTPWPQEKIDKVEALDLELCDLMDEAEKQCCKFHMGSNSWSPTYKKA